MERVLVDQESLTNVLFWTTFQKLGITEEKLEFSQESKWRSKGLSSNYLESRIKHKIRPSQVHDCQRMDILQHYLGTTDIKLFVEDSFYSPSMYEVSSGRLSWHYMSRQTHSSLML
ncbi:hypothetical protein CR513_25454, partial [Mucuna pruriens]